MSQAPAYVPAESFADSEANNAGGRSTVRTALLDQELSSIAQSIAALCDNLELIQRDDGEIRDAIIEPYHFSTTTKAYIGGADWNPRGLWVTATSYAVNDLVDKSGSSYICATAHTSGTFATDYAAGKWQVLVPEVFADGLYVTTIQTGTGAVSRSVTAELRDHFSVKQFGAVGDGATDDTAACQACITAALAAGKSIYFPAGTYLITTTLTVNAWWNIFGDGPLSIVKTNANIALFTFDINTTTVNFWSIDNLYLLGPASSNVSSCALRFIGDNTAFVQNGRARFTSNGFNAVVKDEKLTRTTGFGEEAMLNWNVWDVTIQSPNTYGYWLTKGSGTGNQWFGVIKPLTNTGACIFVDGSGCVVGDMVVAGQWGCQAAGGTGLKIGASTGYRAQINLAAVQFDSNCDIPISMSSTGAITYKNLNLTSNNMGGATTLGAGLQPLYASVIQDRDAADWLAGNAKTSNTVGAISQGVFTIDFAAYGAGRFRVYANGLVGGVSACASFAEFEIREGTGSLTVTMLETYVGVTNGFSISVTPAGTTATVYVGCTSSSAGTAYNVTINGVFNGVKITRA